MSAIALVQPDETREAVLFSEDAEQAVLSAMLMDADAIPLASATLKDAMFYREGNRPIYRALVELNARGIRIDPLIVAEELSAEGELGAVGGKEYIGYLLDVVPTSANIEHHAAIVAQRYQQRTLIDRLASAHNLAVEGSLRPDALREMLVELDAATRISQRRVRLTSEAELEAIEPPAWRIDGVLPEAGLALLFGASETFKSFIALLMAWCIGLGMDFHGHRVRHAPVIYVAAEGFFGLKKRYLALKAFFGLSGSAGIHFLRHGIDVAKGSADVLELIEAIREIPGEPALIVLDTLNRCLVGNENLPDDMGNYLRGCDQLREATGAAVISIHHTGHAEAERSRGHSSLRAALDVEIKCSRDGDRVTLECTKLKDGPHFPKMAFDMTPSGDSLVPNPVGTVDVKWTPSRLKAAKALLSEAGLTRSQWANEAGLKPGTLRHALDWLTTMGYASPIRGGKYVRTEACTQALVPECQASATGVPEAEGKRVPDKGGIR